MLEHHTATLVRVAEFFSKDPEVVGLILAGSLAHGFYTADSDVDVMLVVSDRDHAERLRTVRTGFFSRELCTYEAGYVDGKYISEGLLRQVAARGSEPARFAFKDARVIFSKDPALPALVEQSARYPSEGKADRIRRFQAQVEAWRWYSSEALKQKNLPLLRMAVAKLTLFAGRIVLAHNELLYPYHKWFLRVLEQAPDKPPGLLEKMLELSGRPSLEGARELYDLVNGFREWNAGGVRWPQRFLLDTELAWMRGATPIDDT